MKEILNKIQEIKKKYDKSFDEIDKKMNNEVSKYIHENLINKLNKIYRGKYIRFKNEYEDGFHYLLCDCFILKRKAKDYYDEWDEIGIKIIRGYYKWNHNFTLLEKEIKLNLFRLKTIEIIDKEEYLKEINEIYRKIKGE